MNSNCSFFFLSAVAALIFNRQYLDWNNMHTRSIHELKQKPRENHFVLFEFLLCGWHAIVCVHTGVIKSWLCHIWQNVVSWCTDTQNKESDEREKQKTKKIVKKFVYLHKYNLQTDFFFILFAIFFFSSFVQFTNRLTEN